MRTLFRLGVSVPQINPTVNAFISELEKRISSAIKSYADSERASAITDSDSYLRRFDVTAYEAMKNLAEDADDIARYALSAWSDADAPIRDVSTDLPELEPK